MEAIQMTVTGTSAVVSGKYPITAGTVGLPVEFTFDSQWQPLQKTAVFRVSGKCLDCVNIEKSAIVPWELLKRPGCRLWCGVYGTDDSGTLQIPTVWADLGEILPGADPSGDESADPTAPVWQQLTEDVESALDEIIRLQDSIILGGIPAAEGGDGA